MINTILMHKKKLIALSLIVFLCVIYIVAKPRGFFDSLFGENEEIGLEDDVAPLTGIDLEWQTKIVQMQNDYAALPPEKRDEGKFLLDQNALMFDLKLGPNHPRKKEYLEAVTWSYETRKELTQSLEGKVSSNEMFKAIDAHFQELAKRYEDMFSDEEYTFFFQLKKGENWMQAWGATPELAAEVDAALKNARPDPESERNWQRLNRGEKPDQDWVRNKFGDP